MRTSPFVCSRCICSRQLERSRSRLLQPFRHIKTRTATTAAPRAKAAPRSRGLPSTPRSSGQPTHNLQAGPVTPATPRINQKAFAAKQLYDKGVRNVYRAPSHIGKLSLSWLIGVFCIGNTTRMFWEGFYELREGHGLSYGKKTAVESGNRLAMIMFTLVGGYAILRYRGLVKSLDLVQRTALSTPELRISVRRFIPLLPTKKYYVPSYDLRLPEKWRKLSQRFPDSRRPGLSHTIARLTGWPFRTFKSYVMMDGILAVNFREGQTNALLDTHGVFTPNVEAIEAMTTEVQPWDR